MFLPVLYCCLGFHALPGYYAFRTRSHALNALPDLFWGGEGKRGGGSPVLIDLPTSVIIPTPSLIYSGEGEGGGSPVLIDLPTSVTISTARRIIQDTDGSARQIQPNHAVLQDP